MQPLINRIYKFKSISNMKEISRTEIIFKNLSIGLVSNESFKYYSMIKLIKLFDI